MILIFRFSRRSRFHIAIFVLWYLVAFVKHYLSKAWFFFPSHIRTNPRINTVRQTAYTLIGSKLSIGWYQKPRYLHQHRLVSKALVSVQTSNEVNSTDVLHRMAQPQITHHPHCHNSQLMRQCQILDWYCVILVREFIWRNYFKCLSTFM